MANISVVVEKPIADGYKLKFRTPCDSTVIEGLEVKYPLKNGIGSAIKKFVFKDAHGTDLSGVGNLFISGVMIEVLLDVTHGVAYIKNADTNSYVESVKSEVQRLEDAQRQFLNVVGKSVEECERIIEKAERGEFKGDKGDKGDPGIYLGSGDMPEGYYVQIDPNGDCMTEEELKGYTPQKGVDYYTETDKAEMVNAVLTAMPVAEGVSY